MISLSKMVFTASIFSITSSFAEHEDKEQLSIYPGNDSITNITLVVYMEIVWQPDQSNIPNNA